MTKFKLIPATLVAALLMSGATVAGAQDMSGASKDMMQAQTMKHGMKRGGHGGHGMMRQIMAKADANGDGAVTQDEIDTFRASLVEDADVSGDGNLSLDEFQAIHMELMRERMVDMFQRLDADGDGAVTQAEMDDHFGNIVARMDRNDDGQLDRDDRRGGKGKKQGGGTGMRSE